ncbi:MAG TPA: cytochrome c oxidase assembly protein [Acidimicrobiales bacterium]|nr:cytochrome c oxidase assembly protein [Acidimicrobiales bacterium]
MLNVVAPPGGGRRPALQGVQLMPGMGQAHFDLHNALTAWQGGPFALAATAVLVLIAYWYLRADWRLASRGRSWRGYRTAAFLAGLAAIDLALQSPVSTFTGSYFQAHVVQHLLLMAVAPPLLALGAPSTLFLQSARRRWKTWWLGVLRSRPFAVVTHPVVVWFMYFGAMFAFFLTPLVNFAMEHMDLMDAINVGFLLGGCFYWWPMVGLDPIVHWRMGYGARMANLAIGVPFESFLGVAIMSDRSPVASMYSLASTHAGGALLWAATEISTFAGLVPVFVQWQRSEQRAGNRADRAAAGAVAVTPRAGPRLASLPAPIPTPARNGAFAEQFRPLLQPGNSDWEELWRRKAGYVPNTYGAIPNSPPLHPEPGRKKTK